MSGGYFMECPDCEGAGYIEGCFAEEEGDWDWYGAGDDNCERCGGDGFVMSDGSPNPPPSTAASMTSMEDLRAWQEKQK